MKDRKELTLQNLMQMSHDMKDLEKDLDMIKEFMSADEIRTILKIAKDK
jgi:hypothetical protein